MTVLHEVSESLIAVVVVVPKIVWPFQQGHRCIKVIKNQVKLSDLLRDSKSAGSNFSSLPNEADAIFQELCHISGQADCTEPVHQAWKKGPRDTSLTRIVLVTQSRERRLADSGCGSENDRVARNADG